MEPSGRFVIHIRVVAPREEGEGSFCSTTAEDFHGTLVPSKNPVPGPRGGTGLTEHGNDVWEQGQVGMSSALGADVL